MKQTINERLNALRMACDASHVAAYIIPSSDPHLSEYVAPHWKAREWISGFTGSAGTVVVLQEQAGLWTDSRYFLQAEAELQETGITLYKEGLPETVDIPTLLAQNLKPGETVGVDGSLFSAQQVAQLEQVLAAHGLQLNTTLDLLGEIWKERPAMPQAPAFLYEESYAGKSCQEKIEAIRTELKRVGMEGLFVSALDEIAWTLNLRGSDVHCNPVVVSYLLITEKEVVYFIAPEKVSQEVRAYLEAEQVSLHPYAEVTQYLSRVNLLTIGLNPARTNHAIYSAASRECRIISGDSPIALLKAVRNTQEIAGVQRAMQRDGVAMVRFLKWLEERLPTGEESELSIDTKLQKLRAEQPLYKGKSFNTIAGYGAHAAIIHYTADATTNATLQPKGFLLLDSGAQYLDGTTDITRTIALGELTDEEREDYTLVLKGHIALSQARFPAGTRGAQLDVLARMPMWSRGMNYLHGTGHGVGHFLSVHEGPQSIRMNENPIELEPGMVTSNEPGIYKAGSHGIRIENLLLVRPAFSGMFGEYLQFETLTLCPICTKGVIREMLTAEELSWLNEYHQRVYTELAPALDERERDWLQKATQII